MTISYLPLPVHHRSLNQILNWLMFKSNIYESIRIGDIFFSKFQVKNPLFERSLLWKLLLKVLHV